MAIFTAYDSSGNLALFVTAADLATAQANVPSNYTVLSGSHPATWNNAGTATALGTITPTVAGLALSGLPSPCTVIVPGQTPNVVVGGAITLSGLPSGANRVLIKAAHYVDAVVTVTAP